MAGYIIIISHNIIQQYTGTGAIQNVVQDTGTTCIYSSNRKFSTETAQYCIGIAGNRAFGRFLCLLLLMAIIFYCIV